MGSPTGDDVLVDVRRIEAAKRQVRILEIFDRLRPGGAMMLVDDREPGPFRYLFDCERAGEFTWRDEATGPFIWRARVVRIA